MRRWVFLAAFFCLTGMDYFKGTPTQPSSPTVTAPSGTPTEPSYTPEFPSPFYGTYTAPSPGGALPPACLQLPQDKHREFAKQLSGNEQILFCSIFNDVQRDQVIGYTQMSPPMSSTDAVLKVAKDNNLLPSSKPGGACAPH